VLAQKRAQARRAGSDGRSWRRKRAARHLFEAGEGPFGGELAPGRRPFGIKKTLMKH
jgi:hypothetical protein